MPDITNVDSLKLAFFQPEEIAKMKGVLHAYRRVMLSGQLNASSIRVASLECLKLELQSNEPITLLLESGGGDVEVSQQFADLISSLNSPVDVVAINDCSSMAVDLMQMCRRRMLLPSTRLLVHYIRYSRKWIGDDPEILDGDLKYFKEELDQSRESRLALYERRTGLSRERLAEIFRYGEVHASYFTAQQAVGFGMADEILTDFKLFPITKKEGEKKIESGGGC